MDIDITNYDPLWQKFPDFADRQDKKNFHHIVSFFSVAFGVHVLVSGYFYLKYFGDSEDCRNGLKSLTDFYSYVTLINVDKFLNDKKGNEK